MKLLTVKGEHYFRGAVIRGLRANTHFDAFADSDLHIQAHAAGGLHLIVGDYIVYIQITALRQSKNQTVAVLKHLYCLAVAADKGNFRLRNGKFHSGQGKRVLPAVSPAVYCLQ